MTEQSMSEFCRGWILAKGISDMTILNAAFIRGTTMQEALGEKEISSFALGYVMASEQKYGYNKACEKHHKLGV